MKQMILMRPVLLIFLVFFLVSDMRGAEVGPTSLESDHQFLPTLNKMGYQKNSIDIIEQAFIDSTVKLSKSSDNMRALEIGAGYGHVTIEALEQGAQQVYANDLDERHLAILKAHLDDDYQDNLVLIPGSFPYELEFPDNYFDAILIARVLHFFTGEQIEDSFKKIRQWLKPGGSVFVTVETPYLGSWQQFIPEYERRKNDGEKWPGLITNPSQYEKNRTKNLPSMIHHLDDDILSRVLTETGFEIEYITLIDRTGAFPQDVLYDGRESVGAIAIKPKDK